MKQATSYSDQSLRTAIQEGDTVIRTLSLAELGDIALQEGQFQQAEKLLQECYQLRLKSGERLKAAYTLRQQGVVASELGREAEARQKIEQSLAQVQELQDAWGIGAALIALANLDLKHQRYEAASQAALQGYECYQKANSRLGQVEAIQALAQASAFQDKIEGIRAVVGTVEREREEMNTPVPPNDQPRLDLVLNHLESRLGSQRLKAYLKEGRKIRLDQAAQVGLAGVPLPLPEAAVDNQISTWWLQIYALGESWVEVNGRVLSSSDWSYTKAKELLYYLLTHPPVTKGQIGLDLWPDHSPSQLRTIFHRVLHELRRALEDPQWIVYEQGRYRFCDRPSYWFDLNEFNRRQVQTRSTRPNAARSAMERTETARILLEAVNLWRGDFLQDLDTAEWAILYRENLRQEFIYTLIDLGQIYFADAHYSAAADIYRRVLALDGYLELAHRELMRCFARIGETGQALHQFQQLKKLLQDELEAVPSPETTLVYERLRRGDDI